MGLLNLPVEVQRSILDHVSCNVSLFSNVQLRGLHFVSFLTIDFLALCASSAHARDK